MTILIDALYFSGTTDSRAKRLYYEGLELEPISQRYVGIHGICSLPRSTDKPTSEAACRSEYIMVRVPMDFKVQWQAIRPQIGERYIFRSHKKWEKSEERRVALEAERDGGQSQGARTPGEESSDPKGVDGIEREISGDEIKPQEKWIKKSNCDISSIHSIPKKVVALVQLYSAIQVIWEAKDSEYGYAAYQLTLIPYALMSFLNIVNSLLTPTYPMLYMIESETMKEARSKGGIFEGTIGKLCELSIAEPENTPDGNEKTAEPENKPDGNEKSIREICADLDGIQFKRIDMDQIQEHKEHKLSEMICGASKYIFTHLIGEHIRREIYIARFHWREPGAMLRSNVRRIFNRAPKDTPSIIVPKDTPSIMVSPFGCPILRKLRNRDTFMTVIADILLTISLVAPYIATYYLTGYTNGKSTVFQRALFVMWLVLGQVSHFFQRMFWGYLQARVVPLGTKWLWGVLAVGAIPAMIFMLVPAGGILMVANMYWLKLKPPSASSSATAAISSTASIIATSSIIATASISAITSITATASVGAIVSITATASVGAITSDGASASITASTSAAGLLTL